MNCPHCRKPLTEAEVKSLWASYCGKRQTPHTNGGAGGRPKSPRCFCGKFTAAMAEKRGHKCRGMWANGVYREATDAEHELVTSESFSDSIIVQYHTGARWEVTNGNWVQVEGPIEEIL